MKLELLNLKEEIIELINEQKTGREKLLILSVGNDPSSEVYMKNKVRLGQELGIETIHMRCEDGEELETKIRYYNEDIHTTGIIVQLPLLEGYNSQYYIDLIRPEKDVDLLTSHNKSLIAIGKTELLPATATSCVMAIEKYYGSVEGADILLIGRSNLCNVPLIKRLSDMNATVMLCHSKTKDLGDKIRNSNIVVSAAGVHGLIKEEMISDKLKLILDVSINRIDGKIKGDVVDGVYELTTVSANPFGIGSCTCANLFFNLVKMSKMC